MQEEQQSPIDLCDARDLTELDQSVASTQVCLNFFYSDLSNNGYVRTRLKFGDGLDLEFHHPPGNDLTVQTCSLPLRVGRQQVDDGDSFTPITWKLDHATFHWGERGQYGGSEHFIEGRRHALELQFKHYNMNKFGNYSSAVDSGVADAVLVVAQVSDTTSAARHSFLPKDAL